MTFKCTHAAFAILNTGFSHGDRTADTYTYAKAAKTQILLAIRDYVFKPSSSMPTIHAIKSASKPGIPTIRFATQ
jgi:hypothetical protein